VLEAAPAGRPRTVPLATAVPDAPEECEDDEHDDQYEQPSRHVVTSMAPRLPRSTPVETRLYRSGVKKRLDAVLVERGLAETRSQAQALILAGLVPGYEKPGQQVDEAAEIVVERPPRFVSRGGDKLQHALDAFGVDPTGRDCVDVGASTGGFTDALLQAGAARVAAIDVGYGQLHPRLRGDPRVTVLERTNARDVRELPFAPDLVTCDVSFISVTKALPPVLALARPSWEALVLVKPQFEAGREHAPRGVVRDLEVRRNVLETIVEAARAWGGETVGVVDSQVPGPKGNREFFLHLVNRQPTVTHSDLDRWIDDAVHAP
jgi:23S rRNA (cytidine1920-2'-O)/16S rRNA (cytidine1409-2'-O)-methyltransferase